MSKTNSLDYRSGLNRVGIVLVILLGIATVKRIYDSEVLARTARVTQGTVTAPHCTDHGSIAFTYEVDGTNYTRDAIASACGLPTCDKTMIGRSVSVTYSSEKPALATCASLGATRNGAINQVLVVGLLAVSVGFSIWREKVTKRA